MIKTYTNYTYTLKKVIMNFKYIKTLIKVLLTLSYCRSMRKKISVSISAKQINRKELLNLLL